MIDGLITLVIGIIVMVVGLVTLSKRRRIKKIGLSTDAVVYDLLKDSNSAFNVRYPVIRFLTENKVWITESVNLGVFPGLYKKGEKVVVVYDRNNPKNFVIESKINNLIPHVLIIAGFLVTIIGTLQSINIKF